jgi:hypothetical protein
MRQFTRLVLPSVLALGLAGWALPAGASHNADNHSKMDLVFTSPNSKVNSDIAFWGDHAFAGYYRNDLSVGGFRIFDISNPAAPQQLVDYACDGLQADPFVWDRDNDGIADLLLLAVDRTMANSACGAARVAHDATTGWEGVRVFTLSDNPANPFADIEQVAAVQTDCGAHTITGWPDLDDNRLRVYVSSYPLRPGPTCGPVNGPANGESALHEQISVINVPLGNPAAAAVIAEPPVSYPDDPDEIFDIQERGLDVTGTIGLNDLIGCHDIAVDVRLHLAAAACAEQGQLWEVDAEGMPDTGDPIWISDDEVSSDGAGDIPGAIDFFHSATFSRDGSVVNWIDESFAPAPGSDECPPTTDWEARAWHPAGSHKTGRMFFADGDTGAFLSEFQVGDLRPEAGAYCSAHMGLPVTGSSRDLLVNAWYMGGVDVVDFSNPSAPKEVAYYDMAPAGTLGSDNWSAYSYLGPKFPTGPGIPIYASDGVHNPNSARGFVVFRAQVGKAKGGLDHLNPQTQE